MIKKIVNLIYELGVLKYLRRSGWIIIRMKDGETVAEHSLRAAQIGYILAKMEKYSNPGEVVTALVFHEIGETRVGDLNYLSRDYLSKEGEILAVKDQVSKLFPEIFTYVKALEKKEGNLGRILKDADILENAFTACEYLKDGHSEAAFWLKNIQRRLSTESGKKLFREILKIDPDEWWKNLNKT